MVGMKKLPIEEVQEYLNRLTDVARDPSWRLLTAGTNHNVPE